MKPKDKPLSVHVSRNGVLTIEIGIETLAFASLRSEYAYRCADEYSRVDPRARFSVSDARGFAVDVKRELLDEAEDGSSLLTRLFDKACEKAVEEGSEFWVDKEES